MKKVSSLSSLITLWHETYSQGVDLRQALDALPLVELRSEVRRIASAPARARKPDVDYLNPAFEVAAMCVRRRITHPVCDTLLSLARSIYTKEIQPPAFAATFLAAILDQYATSETEKAQVGSALETLLAGVKSAQIPTAESSLLALSLSLDAMTVPQWDLISIAVSESTIAETRIARGILRYISIGRRLESSRADAYRLPPGKNVITSTVLNLLH